MNRVEKDIDLFELTAPKFATVGIKNAPGYRRDLRSESGEIGDLGVHTSRAPNENAGGVCARGSHPSAVWDDRWQASIAHCISPPTHADGTCHVDVTDPMTHATWM